MKKVITSLFICLMLSSCVAHTPATNSRIEIGYEEDKGAFIGFKLFDSDTVTKSISNGIDWIIGGEDE